MRYRALSIEPPLYSSSSDFCHLSLSVHPLRPRVLSYLGSKFAMLANVGAKFCQVSMLTRTFIVHLGRTSHNSIDRAAPSSMTKHNHCTSWLIESLSFITELQLVAYLFFILSPFSIPFRISFDPIFLGHSCIL